MLRCIDPEIGRLIHAYELNVLIDAELEQFEVHVLACDYCFEELGRFEKEACLLMSDGNVKEAVKKSAGGEFSSKASSVRRLWPKMSFLLKPAVAYALLVVCTASAFLFRPGALTVEMRERGGSELTVEVGGGNRAGERAVTLDDTIGKVVFDVYLEDLNPGRWYRVELRFDDDNGFVIAGEFVSSAEGCVQGKLGVSARHLRTGRHVLRVKETAAPASSPQFETYYLVKRR